MDRRRFLAASAGAAPLAAAADPGPAPPAAEPAVPPPVAGRAKPGRMIGLQIHPFSLYDEGIDRVLDLVQGAAAVDTLWVYSHLYGADHTMPADVLAPDHGVPVRAGPRNLPRVWVRHSPGAFDGLLLKHPKTPAGAEYADKDLFAELIEPAKKRGMRVVARVLEPRGPNYLGLIPNWGRVLTVDLDGRPGRDACWNHPEYRAWWLATVEDLMRSYPLDGFMFGAERVGPLSRLLALGEAPTCFCRHCAARARDQGIDPRRLKDGYREVAATVTDLRAGKADDGFTRVLRGLMRAPEVLAWEYDWARSLEDVVAGVAGTVKAARPKALAGRHVDHQQTSWDVLYRAAVTLPELADPVDFVKPATYHEIAAPRVRNWFLDSLGKTVLRGVPPEHALDLYYDFAGLDRAKEPRLGEMMARGFSPDYVYRETKRFVDGVAGRAAVYPGVGLDIPWHSPAGPKRFPSDPESNYLATLKAFEAGADGVIVCREYQEMRVPNLRAVGRAVRKRARPGTADPDRNPDPPPQVYETLPGGVYPAREHQPDRPHGSFPASVRQQLRGLLPRLPRVLAHRQVQPARPRLDSDFERGRRERLELRVEQPLLADVAGLHDHLVTARVHAVPRPVGRQTVSAVGLDRPGGAGLAVHDFQFPRMGVVQYEVVSPLIGLDAGGTHPKASWWLWTPKPPPAAAERAKDAWVPAMYKLIALAFDADLTRVVTIAGDG